MASDRKRRRAARRIKAGDGSELKRFRWWQLFFRSLFHARIPDAAGEAPIWSVDVRHGGDSNGEVWAVLYRAGKQHARSKPPALFPVPGGTIEVATSGYGLRRCHFVAHDGTEYQLSPDPRSAEGRRARLEHNHPGASRLIGAVSWTILAVALVLGVPQLVQEISQIPPVAERLGTFTSPFQLPAWFNFSLVVASLLASTERALRLRHHWLLDGGLFDGES
ncbi:hypothetical protein ACPYO6_14480 [Georgenia sp. Z1344]|uniref:hypothetical protein n=1 Tax=Georgenia sp. Z1344 TaxID=3416706 RepID=UPI003CF24548